jgi:CheY-like chemotaxis protein
LQVGADRAVCHLPGAARLFYGLTCYPGPGFDAVLLDLTIPGGMGGIEAAAKLKEMDLIHRQN